MIERETIVAGACGWLGTHYHHQASVKGVGCDCLGLVRGLWRELCGPEPEVMPRYTRDWGNATGSETLTAALSTIGLWAVGEISLPDLIATLPIALGGLGLSALGAKVDDAAANKPGVVKSARRK